MQGFRIRAYENDGSRSQGQAYVIQDFVLVSTELLTWGRCPCGSPDTSTVAQMTPLQALFLPTTEIS